MERKPARNDTCACENVSVRERERGENGYASARYEIRERLSTAKICWL